MLKVRNNKVTMCLILSAAVMTAGTVPAMAAESSAEPAANLITSVSTVEKEAGLSEVAKTVQDAAEQKEEEEAAAYASLGVAQVDTYMNVRAEATTDSDIVGRMENNSVATVIGEEGDWYQIQSGNITGYVMKQYLTVGDATLIDSVRSEIAVVSGADVLNVRSEASEDASILGKASEGDQLIVTEDNGGEWVAVQDGDTTGYVSAEYVQVSEGFLYATEPVQTADSVVDYALQFVGNPYVWGGTSLTNGCDCSGFIMSVYAHFGVSLPHSSRSLRSVGTQVSYSEAQPGDIICYSGHVALYIGNGQIVHASNPRQGIIVSSATYKSIITVRRIFD